MRQSAEGLSNTHARRGQADPCVAMATPVLAFIFAVTSAGPASLRTPSPSGLSRGHTHGPLIDTGSDSMSQNQHYVPGL
jgi:hypothetical protein